MTDLERELSAAESTGLDADYEEADEVEEGADLEADADLGLDSDDGDGEFGEEVDEEPAREQSMARWLIETVLLIALAFALAQGVKTFLVQPFVIPTSSMETTIMIGDYVLADKLSFRLGATPKYGEIVVFDDPMGEHPQLIKRVIATEGQTVDVRDNKVWVDGKALDEEYTHGLPSLPGSIPLPVKVGPGEVWLMGDNRTNSGDSRYFGARPVSTVRGRAFWRYWPPNRFGPVE